MENLSWKVEYCPQCSNFAVKSVDEFWGCLKCQELPDDAISRFLEGKCVYCDKPLILLMESCLSCGNQPKYLTHTSHPKV